MTSLAQQLQRLALPQTDPSLLSRREVASLLFDPKEAATIDRDTAFAIGESPSLSKAPGAMILGRGSVFSCLFLLLLLRCSLSEQCLI